MLGVTGQAAALAPLLTTLTSVTDATLRATAARALGRLGDPGALSALVAAASDPDPAVVAAARRAATSLRGASAERPVAATTVLEKVLFITDPAPTDRTAYAASLLEQVATEELPTGAVMHIVTMAPGQPLPSPDEAMILVRRQFQTAPPGYHWEALPLTDEAGRPALLLQLVAVP
jgi:hypothetical protein